MAESGEAAFLASMKAANEENGIYEGSNGAAAALQSNNPSDEYDPAHAVPKVPSLPPVAQESPTHQTPSSALLNETMSTSTVHDVSAVAVPTVQDPSSTNGPDRQSESRSMSRATSSDTSQSLIPEQLASGPPNFQAESAKDIVMDDQKATSTSQQPSSAVPTAGLDDTAVTPASAANETPKVLIPNGDSLATSDPQVPSNSDRVPSVDGELANPAVATTNTPDITAAPALKKEAVAPPSSTPKARLPHDTIGILEDRIKEDPRGDMDAWLSLIGEYRKRGKLDEARSVYERFFAVFPAAVRPQPKFSGAESTVLTTPAG